MQKPPLTQHHFGLRHYLSSLIAYAPVRVSLAWVLLLAVGMTEGIGLLLLVPLLNLLGIIDGNSSSNFLSRWLEQGFTAVGAPLNLINILIFYVTLVTLRALLLRYRDTNLALLRQEFVDHLRTGLYQAIGYSSWLYLSRKRTSDYNHVLTSDINRVVAGTQSLLQLLVGLVMVLVHVGVAVQLSTVMTLIALGSGGLLSVLLLPQVKRAKLLGETLTNANRTVYGTLAEFFDGIKLAKSYGVEGQYIDSFNNAIARHRQQLLSFVRSNASVQMLYQTGAALVLSLLLYIATIVVVIPVAELLVLILIFARLLPQISALLQSSQYVAFMLPAYSSAMKMQADFLAHKEILSPPDSGSAIAEGILPVFHHRLSLENVCFRYGESTDAQTLTNINIVVSSKKTLGIVGPSGAGKSTLADLFAGLIHPDSGSILLDGQVLQQQHLIQWRKKVSYVTQDTFLFHRSIKDNLLWAKPEATDEELERVLTLSASIDFVRSMHQGIDTIIGDRGVRLSGGERQRIALARALLTDPALLILDEATSALDTQHERQIQQAIDTLHGELTIIIIAHRLSTVKSTDHIVVVDKGKIVESGNWNQLMGQEHSHLRKLAGSNEG